MKVVIILKKILITGINSYIGDSFADWVSQWPNEYQLSKWDFRNNDWKEKDLSQFDVILHVAGIAHQKVKGVTDDMYYKVNTDLTLDIAKKAKEEGVKQFIFMSSMIVYGGSSKIGEDKCITPDTKPTPVNAYGDSKLQADLQLFPMSSDRFKVVILRPPMIYGPNSKGNFPLLVKFAKILPIFPNIENKRSMLFIDNLTEYIRKLIEENASGIYFPQNTEYVCTSKMVEEIAKQNGRSIKLTKILNPLLKFMSGKIGVIDKVFGSLRYEKDTANTCFISFDDSIKKSLK